VPALRERREDIPLLVEHFVRQALGEGGGKADKVIAGIAPDNWARLSTHPWPGHVRELRNVVERSLALDDPALEPRPARTTARGPFPVDLDRTFHVEKAEMLERFESAYLTGQLERHGGNFSRAARAAGMERMHFKRLLRKHQG
jgi:DNA-binding NtrC family response regulator